VCGPPVVLMPFNRRPPRLTFLSTPLPTPPRTPFSRSDRIWTCSSPRPPSPVPRILEVPPTVFPSLSSFFSPLCRHVFLRPRTPTFFSSPGAETQWWLSTSPPFSLSRSVSPATCDCVLRHLCFSSLSRHTRVASYQSFLSKPWGCL